MGIKLQGAKNYLESTNVMGKCLVLVCIRAQLFVIKYLMIGVQFIYSSNLIKGFKALEKLLFIPH